ncbi:MAG: EAL domain-containing protein [Pseudomonadota bacterium]
MSNHPHTPSDQPAGQRLPPNAGRQLLDLMERTTGACVWVFEVPARRMHWSSRLAALLELAVDKQTGPAWTDPLYFYTPESRLRMAVVIDACMSSAYAFDEEVQVVTARGKAVWLRVTGEALGDISGSVVRIQGVMQDLTAIKQAEQEALSITMRLSTTLGSIKEAFVTLDHMGCFNYINREGELLLQRSSSVLLGREIWQELAARDNNRLQTEIRAVLDSGQNTEFDDFYLGLNKWLELRAYPFEEGVALYLRDITLARESQEQLLLLQTSISHLNDIVLITEAHAQAPADQCIVFVNDAFERHTGFQRGEVLGKTPRLLQGHGTQRSELDRIRAALEQAQPVRAEIINYKKNGDMFWIELDIVPVVHASRGLTHWVSVARDITARKAAEDEIEHLAFYDALTQLPNRQMLMDRLGRALAQTSGPAHIGALMFIDLDHFKILNDTLGHSVGDMLLQQVASRLAACLRLSDTVARLGGDEFVVMLEDLGDDPPVAESFARRVGEKILTTLSDIYDLAGYQHHATCSIGITCFNQHHRSVGDLLKQADLAMYQAKASGRNALCFFDPLMQAAATANAALNTELRAALRNKEFVLFYQPQVGHDQHMFAVEALIRWQHPKRGMVTPDLFIPQAEESGLILPIGQWVLETACAQLALWSGRAETAKLRIAVNVSVRQFRQPDFVDQVMGVIARASTDASRLKLELTESLLATDMDVTIAKMGMLKRLGVTLSIDDFGMAYSALSYLKYLPLDQLKIDRSFVKDILKDPNDAAIARTIIGLAQSLGLGVIAEGVENEAQRDLLARFGCECYQGYLFCKALPIHELEAFMQKVKDRKPTLAV